MSHWSAAPMDRNQVVLFAPTLEQSLADDHPVRLFAETLAALDFADWERRYVRVVGQPPIHPRVLAGCILYGLSLGIRSSRRLEDAAANRLDFIWLLEGRVPDHATICKFRTAFGPQIKGLFRQVGRVAIELGLVALNRVMLDGTHIQANNSRYATNRRASLQQKLDALDAQVERLLAEAEQQDRADAELFGDDDGSPAAKLPRGLRDLKARQDRLRRAMANLEKMEQERRDRGQSRGPAVPTSDPDARVLPAKQGGYAPGYTTVLATDARSGFVLDAQVIAGNDEASKVLPAVERTADKPYDRHGTRGTYRVYQSPGCGGCPLAAACLGKAAAAAAAACPGGKARVRRVCRDEYEELRERMAARMDSEAGQAAYRRRGPIAEAAFATLKAVMNLRQYLLRGMEKVRIETDWAVTALNLTKLIRLPAR